MQWKRPECKCHVKLRRRAMEFRGGQGLLACDGGGGDGREPAPWEEPVCRWLLTGRNRSWQETIRNPGAERPERA